MKLRIIAAVGAVLLLAGCESQEQQFKRIENNLPNGCKITDLGEYGRIDNVLVIQCGNQTTTTSTQGKFDSASKTTKYRSTVTFSGE